MKKVPFLALLSNLCTALKLEGISLLDFQELRCKFGGVTRCFDLKILFVFVYFF